LAHQLNDLGSRFGLSPLARSGLLHPSQMDKVELRLVFPGSALAQFSSQYAQLRILLR
jgi:hypothetical protein